MPLLMDMKTLGLNLDYDSHGARLTSFVVRPSLVDQIKGKQIQDERLVKKVHKIMNGEISKKFSITQDGVLTIRGRVCVLDIDDLRKLIMEEAHCSAYAMHLGSTKMYHNIKENYWWSGMKRYNRLCVKMFSLSTSKCGASEILRNPSATTYS